MRAVRLRCRGFNAQGVGPRVRSLEAATSWANARRLFHRATTEHMPASVAARRATGGVLEKRHVRGNAPVWCRGKEQRRRWVRSAHRCSWCPGHSELHATSRLLHDIDRGGTSQLFEGSLRAPGAFRETIP